MINLTVLYINWANGDTRFKNKCLLGFIGEFLIYVAYSSHNIYAPKAKPVIT